MNEYIEVEGARQHPIVRLLRFMLYVHANEERDHGASNLNYGKLH